nr:10550_t:CDS:2 [Entrophospora candida]
MVSDFLSNTTQTNADKDNGGGSSDNFAHGEIIRIVAGLFAVTATLLSTMSIWSHLKNYRKPALQRYVVRIIIMVPIYAISSWISLTSTNAAFYVDAIRDIYEDDLKPYRPIPKFLSTTDSAESISVSIQDFLITFEMVMGSVAHWYAFSFKDYIDPNYRSGRMPIRYAFKDCMGFKDVLEDTLETIRGSRFNYRTFEPAEGMAYIGPSRTARIMAGLRFTGGGSGKYWLPGPNNSRSSLSSERADDDDKNSLNFPDPTPDDEVETMYDYSRKLGRFGDYNFPNKKGKARAKDIFNNNDDDNEEYDFFEDDELINNRIRNGSSSKNRQLSDPNVSPYRIGCIDLVREIPDIEDDDDDETDETDEFDPLGTNRTRHLSNSLKSLEKNIWKEDDYFNL